MITIFQSICFLVLFILVLNSPRRQPKVWFVDNVVFVAHTEKYLQGITSYFTEAAQLFELEVSWENTEVLH